MNIFLQIYRKSFLHFFHEFVKKKICFLPPYPDFLETGMEIICSLFHGQKQLTLQRVRLFSIKKLYLQLLHKIQTEKKN